MSDSSGPVVGTTMGESVRDGDRQAAPPFACESRLNVCVRRVLLLPAFLFAAITILTHAARYLRLEFTVYAAAAGVVTLLAAGLWFLLTRGERAGESRLDRLSLALLLFACGLGAVLASIYRLPDTDDYSYVPDAVHYLSYPTDALGYSVHYAYTGERLHFSIVEATSHAYEYAQALLAYLTGADFLTVYHIAAPAFAGFMLPLSAFLLLSHFSRRTLDSVLGTLLVMGLLTLLGESKIAIGSLSFTRLFQGKILLLAIGVPAFSSLSLDYLRAPTFRRWAYLLIASAALTGLSTTAVFLVPMLALALGIAAFVSLGPSRARIRTVVAYGLTPIYPVAYGLYASRSLTQYLTPTAPGGASGGTLFTETLLRWIVPDQPVSAIVFGVSLVLVGLLCRGFPRGMLLSWTVVACVLYLNPWVAPFWSSRVTGAAIYWRTVFVLPFVALAGTALMACLAIRDRLSVSAKLALTGVLLAGVAGLNFMPGSTSIFRRGGEVGLPGLKVREEAYQVALAVTSQVPAGVMFGPEDVSGITPMVRGGYPQVRLPDGELQAWSSGSADLILRAAAFAEGDAGNREDFLRLVQDTPALRIIVLREEVFGSVAESLFEMGYNEDLHQGRYIVIWRPA